MTTAKGKTTIAGLQRQIDCRIEGITDGWKRSWGDLHNKVDHIQDAAKKNGARLCELEERFASMPGDDYAALMRKLGELTEQPGMRDQFALVVAPVLISAATTHSVMTRFGPMCLPPSASKVVDKDKVAIEAYEWADALIRARRTH